MMNHEASSNTAVHLRDSFKIWRPLPLVDLGDALEDRGLIYLGIRSVVAASLVLILMG
jgi:hypothetical protein